MGLLGSSSPRLQVASSVTKGLSAAGAAVAAVRWGGAAAIRSGRRNRQIRGCGRAPPASLPPIGGSGGWAPYCRLKPVDLR